VGFGRGGAQPTLRLFERSPKIISLNYPVNTGSTFLLKIDPVFSRGYNCFMVPKTDDLKRRLFVIAGTLALALGIAGIIIPVLPTTPFLLLAAICYMRGSQQLYNALLSNRFVGSYVRNYLERHGMSLKMKIWTLSLLWIAIICTALLATDNLIIRIILAVVVIGVTIHILMIKTTK
jgi:uncharacterized membrane protein YbaN (DUF454 family)